MFYIYVDFHVEFSVTTFRDLFVNETTPVVMRSSIVQPIRVDCASQIRLDA